MQAGQRKERTAKSDSNGRARASAPFTDLDLSRWKDYDDILTGSLWLLGARDKTGPHVGDYWGNFVPQVPHQIMRRFTRQGEVVVDLFSGMGTTLIECRHLGRHGIGVELSESVAARSRERIERASNEHSVTTEVLVGDSTRRDAVGRVRAALGTLSSAHADCVILHPPYHDIIRFSDDPRDLSNAPDVLSFLARFRAVAENAHDLLRADRFMALVIGDAYSKSEWVPLGFECMQVCREIGFQLKAINVKDIQGNERGKGKNENLWKYRALKQGFYVFKHEYVMVFRKTDG
ncbi:MAG TPA: DNA methyltransferase [Chloroflexota bacterium]|nr:DNA methyltransferase [Chloroflexota bacterium]